MEDSSTFWSQHYPGNAIDIVCDLLGPAYRENVTGWMKEHHVSFVTYSPEFDLAGASLSRWMRKR
jgi:hypothetical protein